MALNQSCFYKWRCLIALAGVDAKLDPAEKKFFAKQIDDLKAEGISEEQMRTLLEELKHPRQPEVYFMRVDDPIEKIDLLRMAYFLFISDNHFEIREQQVYEYLRREISKSLKIDEKTLDHFAQMKNEKLGVSIKPVIKEFLKRKNIAHKEY